MKNIIRVGFIGLTPDSHWASMSDFPALQSLGDKFTVVGVANCTKESGRQTP
nr:hypothetical protein [uncultured Desulfobacter sp.]